MTEIKEKLVKIAEQISNENYSNIDFSNDISSEINLDSMQFIEFISEIEIQFGIEVPIEMMNVRKADEFISFVEEEINKNQK